MADLIVTDPGECFSLSPFGFGPFPFPGDTVIDCPSYPEGTGYGGVGWADNPYDPPPGGIPYGLGPYGTALFPAPTIGISGGFGGDPYGLGPYGGSSAIPPSLSSAISISAWEIEVYFSEEMDPLNPALINPVSYALTPAAFAATSEVVEVTPELYSSVGGGVLSVILRHNGTTLGGTYWVGASGPTSLEGAPITDTQVSLFTRGAAPAFTVTPTSGGELRFTFDYGVLGEMGAYSVSSIGVSVGEDSDITVLSSYGFESTPDYPIPLTPLSAAQTSATEVEMQVKGMTSLTYTAIISPATALSYDGTVLPSVSTDCIGTELFPSNGSSAIVGNYLSLNRTTGGSYGWRFQETGNDPGHLTDTATFRVDFTFNAEQAQYSPPLSSFDDFVLVTLVVEDAPETVGIRALIHLARVSGVDTIFLENDTLILQVQASWSRGTHTVSLVRNILARSYVLLFDEDPLTATEVSNFERTAEDGPQVSFSFYPWALSVQGFQVHDLSVTATQTVYSDAWNFFHDQISMFVGSGDLAGNWVPTQRGPLVKDWGDATPATDQDVTLRVNGTVVGVSSVNPYAGKVYPDFPIPLMPEGEITVDLDYKWMASPIMEIVGCDIEGLVCDKWDRPVGTYPMPPLRDKTEGAASDQRFPIALVMDALAQPQPLYIGHRYLGFEREYSALTDSPTTLLMDQDPSHDQTEAFERDVTGESVTFDGATIPTAASPVWVLTGTDAGTVQQGTYTVVDALSGSYDPASPKFAFYSREVDTTFPSSVTINARFFINEVSKSDGVFTGVSFGFHDNYSLYLVGALLVNDLEHIGILLDAGRPDLVGSWQIGPKTTATITSSTTLTVPTDEVPTNLEAGAWFQIITGPQVGVYTVSVVVVQCDGTTTLTLTTPFPVDPTVYGNNYPTVYFETPWSGFPSTYRLLANPTTKTALLTVSGETSGQITLVDGSVELPIPSVLPFLDVDGTGQVFWGSLSSEALNRSTWSFVQYGISPDYSAIRGHAIVVTTEMSVPPDEDQSYPWVQNANFGFAGSSGSELLLASDVASETLKFTFGYERIEPFFTRDSYLDLRTKFRMDSGVLGAGDTEIVLNDGEREVRLATLLYVEGFSGAEYRRMFRLPAVSMAGFLTPTEQGWTILSGMTGEADNLEGDLVLTQEAGQEVLYVSNLTPTGAPVNGDRIFQARFAVDSYTGRADGTTGVYFGGDFRVNFGPQRSVLVRLKGGATPVVQLIAGNNTVAEEYPFAWTDGGLHLYRVVASQGAVALYLDGDLQLPTKVEADFPGGTGADLSLFGATKTLDAVVEPTLASVVRWRSVSYSQLPIQTMRRTLGVWKGGDKDHIDSWEIPRTDTSSAKNSAQVGPVIQDMDWRNAMQVRLLRTPGWGVTVYRPDLPPPPYYDGVWSTEVDVPSAGWINVEYADLPKVLSPFGYVAFGALDIRSVTQQWWDYVRYRLYKVPTEDYISHQGMTFDCANIITSGEPLRDNGFENLVVETIDNRRLALIPTNIFAQSIWKVVDGSTIYSSDQFTFDRDSQLLSLGLDEDGNEYNFSGDHVAVTVVCIPGRPYTMTYLGAQPLLDSGTLLNERTPPIPLSQQMLETAEVVRGDGTEGPGDSVGGSVGYDMRTFTATGRYAGLTVEEIDNEGLEGLIYPICEGTLPQGGSGYLQEPLPIGEAIYSPTGTGPSLGGVGASAGLNETGTYLGVSSGAHVIELKGTMFWQKLRVPRQPDFETMPANPGVLLYASGGNFLTPVVDGTGKILGYEPRGGKIGTAVVYPS